MRDWTRLTPSERDAARALALARAPAAPPAARSTLISAHALLLKRAWFDLAPETRAAVFASLTTPPPNAIALEALNAVVAEFVPASASPLGLPWEFHERCRSSFETDWLPHLFAHACAAANATQEPAVASAAMRLAAAVLSWDFRAGAAAQFGEAAAARTAGLDVACEPSASWRGPLFEAPDAPLRWLARWLPTSPPPCGSVTQEAALMLMGRMCALRGATLRTASGLPDAAHLLACLSCLVPLVWPPDVALRSALAGPGQESLTAVCDALLVLSVTHPPQNWLLPLPLSGVHSPTTGLHVLHGLAHAAFSAGGGGEPGGPRAPAVDAAQAAVAAIVALLGHGHRGAGPPAPPDASLACAAKDVFCAAATAALAAAAEAAADDDDGGDASGGAEAAARDERLTSLASLARAEPGAALPLLAGALRTTRAAALAALAGHGADPSAPLEQLTWLIRCTAHVLADSADGETPLPPDAFSCCADAAAALSAELLSTAEAATGDCAGHAGACASARLCEALCWALARWSDTWLLADDAASCSATALASARRAARIGDNERHATDAPHPASAWGARGDGAAVVVLLSRFTVSCLADWPGEAALAAEAAGQLLPALSRRRAVSAVLVATPALSALCSAFASAAGQLAALPAKLHRSLAHALVFALAGLPTQDAAAEAVRALLDRAMCTLAAAAGDCDAALAAPGGEHAINCAAEALRGSAAAAQPRTRAALLAAFASSAGAVEALAAAPSVRARPPLQRSLLRLLAATLDAHLPFATPQDASALSNMAMRIVCTVAGLAAKDAPAAAAIENIEDDARRAKALLQAVMALSSSDLYSDEGDASGAQPLDVGALVTCTLAAVLPLFTAQPALSRFPSTHRLLVSAAAHCAELYPSSVAGMSDEAFGALMAALLTASASSGANDVDCASMALDGLAALCRFHVEEAAAGRPGLNAARGADDTHRAAALLPAVQRVLLSRLTNLRADDLSRDACAEALLPALLAAPASWHQLQAALLQRCGSEAEAQRLAAALRYLTESNGLSRALDRANRRRFRANVAVFAAEVQGLLRVQ